MTRWLPSVALLLLLYAGCTERGAPHARDGSLAPSAAEAAPDLDADHDGVPLPRDACPSEPEDCDGIQDADGCPELDADGDGVPDLCDRCPREPGSTDPHHFFGRGCPFYSALDASEFLRGLPLIFAPNDAGLSPAAKASLGKVAEVMKKHDEHERYFAVGHAAPGERDPDALSERRAAAVVAELTRRGLDAGRLEPHGAGATDPVHGRDRVDFAKSRRVELDVSHNFARYRAWDPAQRKVDFVVFPDLPCEAPPAPAHPCATP